MAYNSNKIEDSTLTEEIQNLLDWYSAQKIFLETLAEFHARYEIIHPFQDGNDRTGILSQSMRIFFAE